MERFERQGLVFPVRDAGTDDGPVAILLHGFPQSGRAWDAVVPHLVRGGVRCLVPDQRGYAAGARPPRIRSYRLAELVEDVRALISASDRSAVHVVGHDWGAVVGWALAAAAPERVASLTALSVPHPSAYVRALVSSRQAFAAWYIAAFALPRLPERYLAADNGTRLAAALVRSGQRRDRAASDAAAMAEPGALRAALNWYRALALGTGAKRAAAPVGVPTLYAWSDGDSAIRRSAARRCGAYVRGPYRYIELRGLSHWLPQEAPDVISALILEQIASVPSAGGA